MRKLAVAALALRAIAFSQSDPRPAFEVVSVKIYKDDGVSPRNFRSYRPEGITFGGCSLGFIISEAYGFTPGRIVGPAFDTKDSLRASLSQGYDIVAKADRPVPKDQIRLMLQSMLADRFNLTLHHESKTGPIYQLVVASTGSKLEESQDVTGSFTFQRSPEGYVFGNSEMMRLSGFLSGQVDRPVVDQSGLKGIYNFTLKVPEDLPQGKNADRSPDSPSTGIYTEALKRLGLRLIPGNAAVDYLVIDSIDHPSAN
jgi:uncharacterized protein (TIGR03435 family)